LNWTYLYINTDDKAQAEAFTATTIENQIGLELNVTKPVILKSCISKFVNAPKRWLPSQKNKKIEMRNHNKLFERARSLKFIHIQ